MARKSASSEGTPARRVFMVELFVEMPDTPSITFFGSKKAIFEYFGNKTLGLSYSSSRDINFKTRHYQNRICRIEEGELYSLSSKAIIDRRAREGREELPTSHNLDGVTIVSRKAKG